MAIAERTLIESIRKRVEASDSRGLIKGIGDDCAIFGNPVLGPWLVSTDMLVEGVHFNRHWHPPRLLGRKSIAVNISDIAAMGGIPRFVLLSLSLTKEIDQQWLDLWVDGVCEILSEYDCILIGGDTVQGKDVAISVTVIGEQHPSGALLRSGARTGDTVYVSGPLGLSAAGLEILKIFDGKLPADADSSWESLINAHLNPAPQVRIGKLLCASGCVSAMQDISDGLATDLSHICKESKVRAVICSHDLPTLPDFEKACNRFDLSRIDCLLRGGEDYQLVFTVRKNLEEKFKEYLERAGEKLFPAVGRVEEGQGGVYLEERNGNLKEITFQGFEHRA